MIISSPDGETLSTRAAEIPGTKNGSSDLDILLFYKVCKYRERNGLKCWKWDNRVWKVAKSHSEYQAANGYMGHDGGSAAKRFAGQRFTHYGIDWTYVGENCAVTDSKGKDIIQIADRILELWKLSPRHNELLLSTNSEFIGISCINGTDYKWSHNYHWWTYTTLNVYRE